MPIKFKTLWNVERLTEYEVVLEVAGSLHVVMRPVGLCTSLQDVYTSKLSLETSHLWTASYNQAVREKVFIMRREADELEKSIKLEF